MKFQRLLMAMLTIAGIGPVYAVGKGERVAVAQGVAPTTHGCIGKYQIATCNSGEVPAPAICFMVDTETGELWSWRVNGGRQIWEKALPGPDRIIATADDKSIKGDLARLQGTWTGSDPVFQFTMTIKEDVFAFDNIMQNGERIGLTSRIVVNDRARPHKTIDQTLVSRYGGSPGTAPDHVFGIYEFIDDNNIRINNGFDRRPSEFGDRGPGSSGVFTLKRKTREDKARN